MKKNMYDSLPQPSGSMSKGDSSTPPDEMEPTENGDMAEEGSENGINSVHLSDHCFANAKDGEDVKGQIEGTVVHEQGGRFLVVHKIDGYPVSEAKGEQPQEEPPKDEAPADIGEAASDFLNSSKRSVG